MDPTLVGRIALPILLVAFAATLLVWPVVRLRRRSGVQAVTIHRGAAAGQRAGALAFLGVQLGAVVLAVLYAARGPAAVGAWPASPALPWIGIALALAGLALVALAQRQMGVSFRIGIDEQPTPLVTSGLFSLVRNPIYTGILLLLAAVVLLVPSPWSVLLWLAAFVALVWHTRLEERHLRALHGDAYRRYAAHTGRFVPGVGRLPDPEAR